MKNSFHSCLHILIVFGLLGGLLFISPIETTSGFAPENPMVPGATDGPDVYGYTWDDGVPSSWTEISGTGTDTGLSGYSYNQATDPIPLPFSFPYYQNSYNSIYIAASGYISFTDNDCWPWFVTIPSEGVPNNVIAPYARPYKLASSGPSNRIYYKSEGTEPNRVFIVEWYEVTFVEGPPYIYSFQVILHENGDIVFNYLLSSGTMVLASAGIEDGAGLDGLAYLEYGDVPALISVPSIQFYRPGASARVSLTPPLANQFTKADQLLSYSLTISNTGQLGGDTFNLTSISTWPVSFFDMNGVTPLDDSDEDGTIDSGEIAQAASRTIIVKMQTPSTVWIGDDDCAIVTVTSSLNTDKKDTAEYCATSPAPFAAVFMDENDGAISLELTTPSSQELVKVTAGDVNGEDAAITETSTGFAIAWSQSSDNGSREIRELKYILTDKAGTPLGSAQKLIENSGAVYNTFDEKPAIDVAPDGRIGIIWKRYLENEMGEYNTNIYFAIIDDSGDLLYGPTSITAYSMYGSYGYEDFLEFADPVIKATPDNHFALAWQTTTYKYEVNYSSTIYMSVRDTANSAIKLPACISSDIQSMEPAVGLFLPEYNFIIIAYRHEMAEIVYSIYDTNGDVVSDSYLEVPLTGSSYYPTYGYHLDLVRLSTGDVLLTFRSFDGQIGYYIMGYPGMSAPVYLDNPYTNKDPFAVSVVADQQGHAIIISSDTVEMGSLDIPDIAVIKNPGRRLYYTLIDHDGSIITSTRPFYSSSTNTDTLHSNAVGYSATSLRTFYWTYLPLIAK